MKITAFTGKKAVLAYICVAADRSSGGDRGPGIAFRSALRRAPAAMRSRLTVDPMCTGRGTVLVRYMHTMRNHLPLQARSLVLALARFRRDVHGVAAIELSIIAPTLVLALVCTADLGLGIYRNMQVQNAAQAGAEYAVTHGFVADSILSAVKTATALSGISASPAPTQFCGCASATGVASAACGSTCPGGSAAGTYVTVSAVATYKTLLPYPLLPSSFTLTAQSTIRIQ